MNYFSRIHSVLPKSVLFHQLLKSRNLDNVWIIFISFCSASLHIPTSVSGPGLLAPICVVSTVEIMTNRWNIIFIAKTIIVTNINTSLNMVITSALTVT